MNETPEVITDTRLGIAGQIEEMDEKIKNCQENGDWKVESVLLQSRNRLKAALEDYPY